MVDDRSDATGRGAAANGIHESRRGPLDHLREKGIPVNSVLSVAFVVLVVGLYLLFLTLTGVIGSLVGESLLIGALFVVLGLLTLATGGYLWYLSWGGRAPFESGFGRR